MAGRGTVFRTVPALLSRLLPGLASVLLALWPAAASADPEAPGPAYQALWVDAFHDGFKTPEQVDRLISDAQRANVNALFVQVRRRGDAYYARGHEPMADDPALAPGFDPLEYVIARAHAATPRMEVHAWVSVLAIWNRQNAAPPNPGHIFNRHGMSAEGEDNWLMLRDDGAMWTGEGYYLDPGHPGAALYTVRVLRDLVDAYDLDGLHLDRVRYFQGKRLPGGGYDRRWGYNPASVARFNARYGREGIPGPDDPDWMAWRREQVASLVRRIYLETLAVRPGLKVSAATVAWGEPPDSDRDWDRKAPFAYVFQDWPAWLEEGVLDFAVPMLYFREADSTQAAWLDGWLAWIGGLPPRRHLVLGLGGFLNRRDLAARQIARAMESMAPPISGVALYSYANPADGENWSSARSAPDNTASPPFAFRAAASIPEMPWKSRPSTGHLAVQAVYRDGAEAEGVRLKVEAEGEGWTAEGETDGTGFLGLVDVPPGRYRVSPISNDGRASSIVQVEVRPGLVARVEVPVGQ